MFVYVPLAGRKWVREPPGDDICIVCFAVTCLPLVSSKSGSLSFISDCNKAAHEMEDVQRRRGDAGR